jgi:hypothetical protein
LSAKIGVNKAFSKQPAQTYTKVPQHQLSIQSKFFHGRFDELSELRFVCHHLNKKGTVLSLVENLFLLFLLSGVQNKKDTQVLRSMPFQNNLPHM